MVLFSICRYEPDENLLPLQRLLTAVENHDQDGEDVSEEALRQQLTWNNYDPRLDSWIVENPNKLGDLIGYASIAGRAGTRCTVYTAVHPEWRRRGLGSRLLDRVIQRGQETGAAHFIVYANAQNEGATAFLRGRRYTCVGDSWILHALPNQPFAEPVWSFDFRMCCYTEVQNPTLLAEIMNQCYGDMWGHSQNEKATTPEGVADMLSTYRKPEHIFLAFAPNGNAAGLCFGTPGEVVHVIDSPGVAPAYRHLQLQRPLLLSVTRHLQSHQAKAIQLLSYGDDEETIAIYQDVGFQLDAQYVAFQGTIRATEA